MSLTTLAAYKSWATITSTDATRDAALTLMLAEVEAAILKKIGQPIESASYTLYLDAPPRDKLVIPIKPVTAVASVSVAPLSNGDPSLHDSTTLLTQYTQWTLAIDQPDGTSSRSGILIRTDGDVWGRRSKTEPGTLAPRLGTDPKAVKVAFTAGYASVPADLVLAVNLVTAKLYQMRKLGGQIQSESLNGYSRSLAASATAAGVLEDPTIAGILTKYGTGGYYFG